MAGQEPRGTSLDSPRHLISCTSFTETHTRHRSPHSGRHRATRWAAYGRADGRLPTYLFLSIISVPLTLQTPGPRLGQGSPSVLQDGLSLRSPNPVPPSLPTEVPAESPGPGTGNPAASEQGARRP